MMYKELTDRVRFNLDIDTTKAYVDGGEATWDGHRAWCKEYGERLDEVELIDISSQKDPGRPVEYPNSQYHKEHRSAQARYTDKQRRIRDAMRQGVKVDEDVKRAILSKIRWLNASGVKPVLGRLVKEFDHDKLLDIITFDKNWYIPYAVEVMCNEGTLYKRRKVVGIT